MLDIITRYSSYGEYRYNNFFDQKIQEYEANMKVKNINDILIEEAFIEKEINGKILENSCFSDYDGLATIKEITNVILHKNGIYYESEIERFLQRAISFSLDKAKQKMNDQLKLELNNIYKPIKEDTKEVFNNNKQTKVEHSNLEINNVFDNYIEKLNIEQNNSEKLPDASEVFKV